MAKGQGSDAKFWIFKCAHVHRKEKNHTPLDIHIKTSARARTHTHTILALTAASREIVMKQELSVHARVPEHGKNSSSLINFYGRQRGRADTCPTPGCSLLPSHHSSRTPRSVWRSGVCKGCMRRRGGGIRESCYLTAGLSFVLPRHRFDAWA